MATVTYKDKTLGDAGDRSQVRILRNRKTALVWLRKHGWKVSQASFYRHVKQGKLEVSSAGTIGQAALELYALSYLQKAESPPDHRAVSGLLQTEKECQVALLRAREEKIRFETDLAKGKYLERDAVLTEFCVKISVFESFLKTMARTNCDAWVAMVEGNPDRSGELYQAIEGGIDEALGEMGRMDEIRVRIRRQPETPTP